MTIFEPQTSGVGSDPSSNWATTTAPKGFFVEQCFSIYESCQSFRNVAFLFFPIPDDKVCEDNVFLKLNFYVYVPTHLPTYLLTHPPTHPPTHTYLLTHPPTYLLTHPPTYLHIYLPIYLPTHLPSYLPTLKIFMRCALKRFITSR